MKSIQVINGLKQLSIKCLKLKSLSIENLMKSSDIIDNLMTEVNKFKALETLQINIVISDYEELQKFNQYLKGFQTLTHLSVIIYFGDWYNGKQINEFLKIIEICLPNLRVLCLRHFGSSINTIQVSEHTADSLGRLSRLQSLELYVNDNCIWDSIIDKVMKNCRKIKKN